MYAEAHRDTTDQPRTRTPKTTTIELKDDGLTFMLKRWSVFYEEVRSPVTPDLLGYLCVVGLEDGSIVVRQVLPGETEGRFDLVTQFSPPLRDIPVVWAAKVNCMTPPKYRPPR